MKKLNITKIEEVMMRKGVSQQSIADHIGVTKSAVSTWFKPDKFPRPNHLYKLAKFLELSFDDLVLKDEIEQAKIAFRKSGNYEITEVDHNQFQYIATLLEQLVPFASIDILSKPPTLIDPKIEYDYIQKVVISVRKEINVEYGIIKFENLIELFKSLHAILVPTLWGIRKKQGTHILLPDSNTTWIFLNLDSKAFDFLFWMAYELGHAKAPFLDYEDGEKFADNFAGALLFPRFFAEEAYSKIIKIENLLARMAEITKIAEKHIIPPITIYKEIEKFAKVSNLESLDLETDKIIWAGTTNFNKKYKSLSEDIFNNQTPSTSDYLNTCKETFKSDFFDYIKQYIQANNDVSPKFIADVLDISIPDAHEIWGELTKNGPK